MITELSKDLIGKTIYGYPTGNNADRALRSKGQRQNLSQFEVVAIGRKYMELKYANSSRTDKFNLNGATQRAVNCGYGSNAGYRFFLSQQDCADWQMQSRKRQAVERYFRDFQSPTDDQINQIHAILFGDN